LLNTLGFWPACALCVLACWRLTHLLAHEDGPGNWVLRLRTRLGNSALGRAMDCFYCLSLWVAMPLALVTALDLLSWALTSLALSGAACLLERATARAPFAVQPHEGDTP
jgi:Protein of unknown function (DUF1360)